MPSGVPIDAQNSNVRFLTAQRVACSLNKDDWGYLFIHGPGWSRLGSLQLPHAETVPPLFLNSLEETAHCGCNKTDLSTAAVSVVRQSPHHPVTRKSESSPKGVQVRVKVRMPRLQLYLLGTPLRRATQHSYATFILKDISLHL